MHILQLPKVFCISFLLKNQGHLFPALSLSHTLSFINAVLRYEYPILQQKFTIALLLKCKKKKKKTFASVQLHTYALVCILMNLSCHHGNGTIKFLPNLVPVSWCLSSRVEGYLKQLVDVMVAYLLVRHAEQTTSVIIGLRSGNATVWRRNGLESLQASRTAAKAALVEHIFLS